MNKSDTLEPGQKAPLFEAQTHEGNPFRLADRKDHGWTVLYFYPKAETPGCTTQSCAFSDAIKKIHKLNAEVYGISSDNVESQADFHKHHGLKFTLLSDPESKVIRAFGAKMPLLGMSKRWTFIVDPALVIRHIERDVDPAMDAVYVAEQLKRLQTESPQGKHK